MAKTKISEWDIDSALNTDINNIDINQGCSPANINNAIRELMAQVKDLQGGYSGDTIPVGYSSFLLSHTSGDQLSIDGRAQLDGMVIGYKGNNPLQPYNPETDLHLVVLRYLYQMGHFGLVYCLQTYIGIRFQLLIDWL